MVCEESRTRACDCRLARLISYIHSTSGNRQYCHVGNTAERCSLELSQDSDFARDLEDSNSTSGGVLCIFVRLNFVPISWTCKKQTAVSHSSTESQVISMDAGERMDGIPAVDIWYLVLDILHSSPTPIGKGKLDAMPFQKYPQNAREIAPSHVGRKVFATD